MKNAKIFVILMCCILLFSALAGCNHTTQQPDETSAQTSEATTDSTQTTEETTNADNPQYNTNKGLAYTMIEVGRFDASDGQYHFSEYKDWSYDKRNSYKSNEAPDEKTIVFEGVEYSGSYRRTSLRIPRLYTEHCYWGNDVTFDINSQTGELVSFSLFEEKVPISTSEEERKEIADTLASKYIQLDEYKVTVSTLSFSDDCAYRFIYYREIDGYETADQLTIILRGDGKVTSFGVNMLGSFDGVSNIKVDSAKLNSVVEEKVNSIFQGITSFKGYDVYSNMLVKLKDGSTAVLYTLETNFEEPDPTGGNGTIHSGSLIEMLVVIEG